jgi:VWFA-related protein
MGAGCRLVLILFLPLISLHLIVAQNQAGKSAEQPAPQVEPTFKIQAERNLVLVRVVVRDSKGATVNNLSKEDFRLRDNNREQRILEFALETAPAAPEAGAKPRSRTLPASVIMPQRFLVVFFDDVHSSSGDIVHARDAADRYLASALQPDERAAVATVSGKVMLDFTADRGKLHEALFRLQAQPTIAKEINPCPDISDYEAFQILELQDQEALRVAEDETDQCLGEGSNGGATGNRFRMQVQEEARRVLDLSTRQSQEALGQLEGLVRHLATMPGQRSIVLVSPGFFTTLLQARLDEVIDRALRSGVVVNTLDAKGVVVGIPFADASKPNSAIVEYPLFRGHHERSATETLNEHGGVLADLASATGGQFFHNSNDLDAGFRKVGSPPEAYYVLAFSPDHLKPDGSFHHLKVTLVKSSGNFKGVTVQARKGYFAPQKALNAVDQAKQAKDEIQQAVLARDELNEIPNRVFMQLVKLSGTEGRLSIWTQLDIRFLHFRKQGEVNEDKLTMVSVLFDQDGKEVAGQQKEAALNLADKNLTEIQKTGFTDNSGFTFKVDFQVKPGDYVVREVVRDEQGQMSALSRPVKIAL